MTFFTKLELPKLHKEPLKTPNGQSNPEQKQTKKKVSQYLISGHIYRVIDQNSMTA